MNLIGPHPAAPKRHARRSAMLALLLLPVSAPVGFVVAGESRSPHVVVFEQDAVSRVAPSADAFSGRTAAFATQAGAEDQPAERVVDAGRVHDRVRSLSSRHRVQVDAVYSSALGGFAAQLTPAQGRALADDPAVAAVVPDFEVEIEGLEELQAGGVRTTANPSVRVPAGIRRVGARQRGTTAKAARVRANADVAVLDTGIQRDHPDLNVVGGYNCTGRNRNSWDDTHGHGTHVAGIVGALDNRIGVVGVAPGVRLWSVKVLGSNGRGMMSWIVCGIDWVTAQRQRRAPSRPLIDVANMSISFGLSGADDNDCGELRRDAIHLAICRAVSAGTTFVVAAGNNAHNSKRNRPGAYDEVITVSALADYDGRGGGRGRPGDSCPHSTPERDDEFAGFSNYGADVDLIAPGRCVLSTHLRGRYAWMSGTSMAAPHAAGAAAIYRAVFPRAKPAQVRVGLRAAGTHDWRTVTDPDNDAHEPAVWIGSFRSAPDFSVRTRRSGPAIAPGSQASLSVDVRRADGFIEPVSISVSGLPAGLRAYPTVITGRRGTLFVEVDRSLPAGSYTATFRAASDGLVRKFDVELVISGSVR